MGTRNDKRVRRVPRRGEGCREGGIRFVLPWLVGLLLLYVGPMAAAAVLAMTSWDGLSWSNLQWVGWANFRSLWDDGDFAKALCNSLSFTAMNVPAQLVVGLALALLVKQSKHLGGFWATVYYLPHVLGGVATILIWWWLLNPQMGPVNRGLAVLFDWLAGALSWLGLESEGAWALPPWLYSPGWSKPSLVLMNLWQAGGGMLVFLAALLRANETQHEAAKLDGAGAWQRFRSITLPQVSPALLFNAVTGVVFSMQAFNQAFLLRNFQQQDSLLFYAVYMYQAAFEQQRFGYAAAQAWVLLGLLLVFTGATMLVTRRWVYYEMDEGTA